MKHTKPLDYFGEIFPIKESYELRTNYRNISAIKGKLEPGGEIFINETAMEESEAAIEELEEEIEKLEKEEENNGMNTIN